MKTLFTILLATICAASGYGQTIRTLGYNSTNGQIVAATNVIWTNAFNFSSSTVAAQVRTNLELWTFKIRSGDNFSEIYSGSDLRIEAGDSILFYEGFAFAGTNAAAFKESSRQSLGLPLAALTNTSNVTMMRALSGSTNTNHPFSGSVSVVGTNNTNVLVFSNGVLQEVQ